MVLIKIHPSHDSSKDKSQRDLYRFKQPFLRTTTNQLIDCVKIESNEISHCYCVFTDFAIFVDFLNKQVEELMDMSSVVTICTSNEKVQEPF